MNSIKESGWQEFLQQCLKYNQSNDLTIFFEVFLTSSEREEIAGRFLIIKELIAANKTQREIAKDLQVSIANVSRGSNVLKTVKDKLELLLSE